MTAELRQGLMLAGIGVVGGLAVVAAYFGTGDLLKRAGIATGPAETAQQDPRRAADLPSDTAAPKVDRPGPQAAIDPNSAPLSNPLAAPDRRPQAGAAQGSRGKDAAVPSLDIVRVEPSGDTVIAGRGLPNASVEVLRDNKPVARVVADETGQFAIVPPPLPPGNSALTLRATAPDGTVTEGRESVAVVVAPDRRTQPLVAVSEPDKATRVLSQPQAPEQAGGQAKDSAKTAALDKDGKPAAAEAGVPVRVVSVDAQDGGRLFVSGQGAAWSSLRLYLNDTLVASGRSGADGKVAFTIGRGVRAGTYQVRIDQVEGESGKVRSRAQVAFAFPAQLSARDTKEPAREQAKDTKTAERRPTTDRAGDKPDAAGKSAGAVAARAPVKPDAKPDSVPDAAGPAAPLQPGAGGGPEARGSGPASPPGAEAKADAAPSPSASPMSPSEPPAKLAESAPPAAPKPGDQPSSVFVPEINTARIVRGDNLWQISRRTYGDGKRYTVIYDANRDQIRDPDLIYPGQIFVMPKDAKDAPAADRQGARRG